MAENLNLDLYRRILVLCGSGGEGRVCSGVGARNRPIQGTIETMAGRRPEIVAERSGARRADGDLMVTYK